MKYQWGAPTQYGNYHLSPVSSGCFILVSHLHYSRVVRLSHLWCVMLKQQRNNCIPPLHNTPIERALHLNWRSRGLLSALVRHSSVDKATVCWFTGRVRHFPRLGKQRGAVDELAMSSLTIFGTFETIPDWSPPQSKAFNDFSLCTHGSLLFQVEISVKLADKFSAFHQQVHVWAATMQPAV